MPVIWVTVVDKELYPRSQPLCAQSSHIQLTASIGSSSSSPSSRVWGSGGLVATSLNFQSDRD